MKTPLVRIGPVQYQNGWGFLDEEGEFVIPPVYDQLGEFSEGAVSFKQGDQIGFLDGMGQIIITPQYQLKGYRMPVFSDGLAAVRKSGEMGYIDLSGAWKISPARRDGFDFVGGHAVVHGGNGYSVITSAGCEVSALPLDEIEFREKWPHNWQLIVGRMWEHGVFFAKVVDFMGHEIIPHTV